MTARRKQGECSERSGTLGVVRAGSGLVAQHQQTGLVVGLFQKTTAEGQTLQRHSQPRFE